MFGQQEAVEDYICDCQISCLGRYLTQVVYSITANRELHLLQIHLVQLDVTDEFFTCEFAVSGDVLLPDEFDGIGFVQSVKLIVRSVAPFFCSGWILVQLTVSKGLASDRVHHITCHGHAVGVCFKRESAWSLVRDKYWNMICMVHHWGLGRRISGCHGLIPHVVVPPHLDLHDMHEVGGFR
jgi:hypothetical protein